MGNINSYHTHICEPIYNYGKYISETTDSIKKNIYSNVEQIKNSIIDLSQQDKKKEWLNESNVERIISFNFIEKPIYLNLMKEKGNEILQTYMSRIHNYPNYIEKNGKKISKSAFKNIDVQQMVFTDIKDKETYKIIEAENNHYTLHSERLYKV